MAARHLKISAVDLFCGVGGLSYGLRDSGIHIAAGVDIDPACAYPFRTNIHAPFHQQDIREIKTDDLAAMWPAKTQVRVLAGCAPCQPFSSHRRGADTSHEHQWPLVDEMSRLIKGTVPDVVTMENVPRIAIASVFENFVSRLHKLGYHVDFRPCYCPAYGVPQHRKRLVLLASRLGKLAVPEGTVSSTAYPTVRQAIHDLPPVEHGHTHPHDRLHKSRFLTEVNLERIKRSRPGGTWEDWPENLRAPCHRKPSGSTFRNVYARMTWDEPSPTITTLAYNFGTGRFGHPEQDRALTLREAANLQSFPPDYEFVADEDPVQFAPLGRLIGNAVPPRLAEAIGTAIMDHVEATAVSQRGSGNRAVQKKARKAIGQVSGNNT